MTVRGASTSQTHRICSLFAGLCGALFSLSPGASFAQSEGDEYAVKGAFILNFGRYTEWLAPATTRAPNQFTICAWRKPYLAGSAGALERKGLPEKKVRVVTVTSEEKSSECDVLFFGAEEVQDLEKMRGALGASRVLTVTDARGTGMINFLVDEGQVRFDLNVRDAARVGIRFSSQLLKLAQHVEGEEK